MPCQAASVLPLLRHRPSHGQNPNPRYMTKRACRRKKRRKKRQEPRKLFALRQPNKARRQMQNNTPPHLTFGSALSSAVGRLLGKYKKNLSILRPSQLVVANYSHNTTTSLLSRGSSVLDAFCIGFRREWATTLIPPGSSMSCKNEEHRTIIVLVRGHLLPPGRGS